MSLYLCSSISYYNNGVQSVHHTVRLRLILYMLILIMVMQPPSQVLKARLKICDLCMRGRIQSKKRGGRKKPPTPYPLPTTPLQLPLQCKTLLRQYSPWVLTVYTLPQYVRMRDKGMSRITVIDESTGNPKFPCVHDTLSPIPSY